MSVPSSVPSMKFPTSASSHFCSTSSSTPFSTFRYSSTKHFSVVIRNSQAEGPLRRPVSPSVKEPSTVPQPLIKPIPPQPPSPQPPSPSVTISQRVPALVVEDKSVITMEFQRQKAKELQEYLKQKKIEQSNQGPFFGFIGNNEISNGRWAMFGFAVGMLTEYATGSDLVDQVKILLSNFGIVDLE